MMLEIGMMFVGFGGLGFCAGWLARPVPKVQDLTPRVAEYVTELHDTISRQESQIQRMKRDLRK